MVDSFTQNGLSIGTINRPVTQVLAAPSLVTNMGELIQQRMNEMNSIISRSYPLDLPKHYMSMTISSYERNSLMSMGSGSIKYMVNLPLPDQMVDMNNTRFSTEPFKSATIGAGVNATLGPLNRLTNNVINDPSKDVVVKGAGEVGQAISDNAGGIGAGLAGEALNAWTGGQGMNAIKAATGYAPNYFMTVLLDGPEYKQHQFSWTFAPKNAQETAELTKIFRILKNASAPGIVNGTGDSIFSFPRIFRCAIRPDENCWYQFKPAVLETIVVDYTGGGLPVIHAARGATDNHAAPAIFRVTARFKELEFWIRSDFGDENALALRDVSYSLRREP